MPMLEIIHSDEFSREQKKTFAAGAMEIFQEVLSTPLGRLRLFFQPIAPDSSIEELLPGGDQPASMLVLRLTLLAGRPDDKRAALIGRLSALAAECFTFPLAEVRFALIEIEPANWGIGGVTVAERQRVQAK